MPDWKSMAEIEKDADAFTKLMHSLLGLYAYEFFLSLNFEWDFLTGRKKFRWPMIFYFANRYLLLFAMIGIAVSFDTSSELNCQALYTFNQLAGDAAVGLASINLSIRTMAIWSQNIYIIGILVLAILGHWSLILQGVQLKAEWVPGVGCQITETNNKILATIFVYSMCFDLTVLLLTTYKLFGIHSPGRSRLTHMVFADGLIYFIIAFLANLAATIFMVLDLNQIMSVVFNVPAAVSSTIVACRAVRRLTNFTQNGPEIYAATNSSNHRVIATAQNAVRSMPTLGYKTPVRSGVHVQMETFTHSEEHKDGVMFPIPKIVKEGSETDVEMDVEAKGSL